MKFCLVDRHNNVWGVYKSRSDAFRGLANYLEIEGTPKLKIVELGDTFQIVLATVG